MNRTLLAIGLAAGVTGCNCRPSLPPPTDPPDTDSETTGETASTADTGPAPPCRYPELEPNNNLDEPTSLGLEQLGCGIIDAPFDQDYWSFVHEGTWLEIEVDAAQNAFTDPMFILSPVGGEWSALREDDPQDVNATLRFLAPPGEYRLVVNDQDFNGGERYGYDLLVSEAKPPTEWNRTETEPNADFASAEPVNPGDRIYGTMDNGTALPDLDFYVIEIPAGKHTLSIDVDAFSGGSSANLTVFLYDSAFEKLPEGCRDPCSSPTCEPCAITGGATALERDPLGQYDSPGSESVYVQVLEASDQEGPANWYVLAIELEE
jgi:hypothetical protein